MAEVFDLHDREHVFTVRRWYEHAGPGVRKGRHSFDEEVETLTLRLAVETALKPSPERPGYVRGECELILEYDDDRGPQQVTVGIVYSGSDSEPFDIWPDAWRVLRQTWGH